MKQHVLVTGGAGYIGSILVPDLLNKGYKVTVLDNFMYGQNSLAHVTNHPLFDVVNGDVRIESVVRPLIKEADVIIPLAALVGAPLCSKDPVGATSINKDAIRTMMKLASNDQWVLMPTTNSGYGVGQSGQFCTEETPLHPLSLYGRDKVEIEKEILDRDNSISFRLATVFGMSPRMRLDLLVNDFTYRAAKDKFIVLFQSHFKRNYIHVRDVSGAFLHALENFSSMKNQAYNVGLSEANISKGELCKVIQKFVPEFVYLDAAVGSDPDQRDYIVSNAKIEATGYKTQVTLDNGIQELLKGFRMIRNSVYSNV